jgi:glycerophosphoryl diester phosphodiesterase
MIEIDLHLSRDGVVMIHHDASLERLAGGKGEIRDHSAAELAELDAAPGWFGPERIPTLPDVLDRFGDRVQLNLEIKAGAAEKTYEGIEEIAIAAVEERGLLSRMLFSSFYDPVLERLRKLSRAARLAVLVSPRAPRRVLQRARKVAAEAINPHTRLVTGPLVRRAHAESLRVFPYTEDDPAGMTRLLDLGVDGIITNHPDRLRRIVDERFASAPDDADATA